MASLPLLEFLAGFMIRVCLFFGLPLYFSLWTQVSSHLPMGIMRRRQSIEKCILRGLASGGINHLPE